MLGPSSREVIKRGTKPAIKSCTMKQVSDQLSVDRYPLGLI
jgi:hypothetical protein